jgi:hypothetical protein
MDDYIDDIPIQYLLVAGFIVFFICITLSLSLYYFCCYRPKANRRKAHKIQRLQLMQEQQQPAPAAVVSVDSHRTAAADLHQTLTQQSRAGDVTMTQEIPAHVSLIMEYDVRYAPPPYYAKEEDLPPRYSEIQTPVEIMTEVNITGNQLLFFS